MQWRTGLQYNKNSIALGAQTVRRGIAGPVRTLLGGNLTGRLFSSMLIVITPLDGLIVQRQVAYVRVPPGFHLHLTNVLEQTT
jgi:hypothetical protein